MRPIAGLAAAALLWPSAAAQQAPIFHSSVELVEVAVIVRDRDGRFVADLGLADFEIVELGAAQKIMAFDRVALPVARPAPARPRPAAEDVSSNERLAESRVFVLLLDAMHVDARRTQHVRRQAREFIEQHVAATDLTAVISPGALPSATQDFTSDKARLLAAVDGFTGTKLGSAALGILKEEAAIDRSVPGSMPIHGGKDPDDGERMLRATSLANVLEALALHMGRVERRRKALLLFSEGIDYNTGDVMGLQALHATEVARANTRALGALMRANVSLYAIDPRGLSSAEGELGETQSQGVARGASLSASVDQEYSDSITSLDHASRATGGFAAVDRNSFTNAFERIVEESSSYYVLGYAPAKPLKPGEFREISVRVSRPGVSVVARKGHGALPAKPAAANPAADPVPGPPAAASFGVARPRGPQPDRAAADVSAPIAKARQPGADLQLLLASPLPLAGLPMRVQAIPVPAAGKKGAVQVVVEVLGAGLQFAERGGRFEERIELAMLTVDSHARTENGRTTTLELRLAPEEWQRAKATGVRWLSRLELAPGRHQLRVAARAARSGATGLVTADVEVAKLSPDRPALSGVTLTSMTAVLMLTRGDAKPGALLETPPSAARTFVAGDQLTAAVEVYAPPSRGELELGAELEWPDGSSRPALRKKIAGAQTQSRAEQVAIPIDTSLLPPGRYALRIAVGAKDAAEADKLERSLAFEILAARR